MIPPTDADVICLWNPTEYFPKLTLEQIAERLLAGEQFGGGGIYPSNAIAQALIEHHNTSRSSSPET
jgi:hypothetical protein